MYYLRFVNKFSHDEKILANLTTSLLFRHTLEMVDKFLILISFLLIIRKSRMRGNSDSENVN